ncbi:murein transglycosylase domain-containing protein [Neptuniibacter caesariensis]|uniref:Membrane-bound lytic murein transglycosylase C n=1 Tax=Neptuniibacter caesariensis TaxID=207954 RepID=A0A7U8C3W4_NEPCE|nr:murein transglycosylase domain-containing protein [Neptuniibacter caesariensis]EAR60764.1 membrane-bound lytic murein transglycosylase C [Neptuniibacter caesariensis]
MLSRRKFILSLLPLGVAGCTTHDAFRIAESVARGSSLEGAITSRAKSKATGWVTNPQSLAYDLKRLNSFVKKISGRWGEDNAVQPSAKTYVKYIDDYTSRSVVDFESGIVRVETLDRSKLKQSIVVTLLSPEDPVNIDLLSADPIPLGEEPFLYKQALDFDNKAVRWEWRANRFADQLISRGVQQSKAKLKDGQQVIEYFVEFPLGAGHTLTRKYRYAEYVEKYARQYRLNPSLVYAIIETESHFNPFAVSWVPAYGLMQIVPKTAGRDAYELIHGRQGTPSSGYLFNPENNIRMGCAYLHILQTRYLVNVRDSLSKEYCVIAAYNGGAGNVLRSFSKDRDQAFKEINRRSPSQVWQQLRQRMPTESQRYLVKVAEAKKRYT